MKLKKTLMVIVMAVLTCAAQNALAGEEANKIAQPKWDELTKLLGKKKDSAVFKAFLKTYKLESIGGPQGTDNFAPTDGKGLSMGTSAKGVVTRVGVQTGYTLPLPKGLKWGISADQVKKILGKPSSDFKGKMLTYKDTGISVFIGKRGLDSVTLKTK